MFFLLFALASAQQEDSDQEEITCYTPGKRVDVPVQQYWCNGVKVNPQEYGDVSNCDVYSYTIKGCLCPADFFGEACAFARSIQCTIRQVSPDPYACSDQGKEYNKELKGYPSCISVDKDQPVQLQFEALCEQPTQEPYLPAEYRQDLAVEWETFLLEHTFDYRVNTETIKLTFDFEGYLVLEFINWNSVTQVFTVDAKMGSSQILGNQLSTVIVTPKQIPKEFWVVGRIYYKPQISAYGRYAGRFITNSSYYTIDDQSFKEGTKDKGLPVGAIIGITVSVVLIIAIIVVIGICVYRKRKVKLQNKEEQELNVSRI